MRAGYKFGLKIRFIAPATNHPDIAWLVAYQAEIYSPVQANDIAGIEGDSQIKAPLYGCAERIATRKNDFVPD